MSSSLAASCSRAPKPPADSSPGLRIRRHAIQRLITRPHRNASDSTSAPLAELLLRACGSDRPSAASGVPLAAPRRDRASDGKRLVRTRKQVSAKSLPRREVEYHGEELLLVVAAGVLFGVSDVAIKYLTHSHGAVFGLFSRRDAHGADLVLRVRRGLQIGLAIKVIAITSVAANLSAIVGGVAPRATSATLVGPI